MECKADQHKDDSKASWIGIYPEWNVKPFFFTILLTSPKIGIYPEWNVKLPAFTPTSYTKLLEYIQNGM